MLWFLPGLGDSNDHGLAVGVLPVVSFWHILVVGENLSRLGVVPLVVVVVLVAATQLIVLLVPL